MILNDSPSGADRCDNALRIVADAASAGAAIAIVAALTAGSGLVVAATPWRSTAVVRTRVEEPCETPLVADSGRS